MQRRGFQSGEAEGQYDVGRVRDRGSAGGVRRAGALGPAAADGWKRLYKRDGAVSRASQLAKPPLGTGGR